ncbi:hypothetical protein Tco_1508799 [Tanacetum coccineum]
METKNTSSSGSVLEEPEIQKLQMQAKIFKENSLNKLNALKSTTQLLERQTFSDCPLYQQAFAQLFGDDIVQLILIYVDSGCSKHMTGQTKGFFFCVLLWRNIWVSVHLENDQFAPILGYEDLIQGNVTIKRVYYVECLNHNLFLVGQFCNADLEVAFRKSTCYINNFINSHLFRAKASPTQACYGIEGLSHLELTIKHHLTPKKKL